MNLFTWSALAVAALLIIAGRTRASWALPAAAPDPVALDDGNSEQGQGGAGFSVAAALSTFDPLSYLPTVLPPDSTAADNVAAFLAMIRTAEGTAGADGYRMMFGGALAQDLADHPRRAARFTDRAGRTLWTTAAGAYQFMAVSPLPDGSTTKVDTWDRLKRKLSLPDFGPESQDAAAEQLIRDADAINDVQAGRLDDAIVKVRAIWASLPGAGYAQPEASADRLRTAYLNAGGTLAAA